MVAATATAILIDIDILSAFASNAPIGGLQFRVNPATRPTDTILTACVNRMVSTRWGRGLLPEGRKGKVEIKVNDLETTLAGKSPQSRHNR